VSQHQQSKFTLTDEIKISHTNKWRRGNLSQSTYHVKRSGYGNNYSISYSCNYGIYKGERGGFLRLAIMNLPSSSWYGKDKALWRQQGQEVILRLLQVLRGDSRQTSWTTFLYI